MAVLVEAIHHEVPTASTRPLAPYDDEDFTLEVQIPAGMDRDTVMDLCLHQTLMVEDQFGFLSLTRVEPVAAIEPPVEV